MQNNKGFTLIEIVIASLILFMAVAAGSLGLRTSFEAMSKVSATTYIAESLEEAVQKVKIELEKGRIDGEGWMDNRIFYSFNAQMIDAGKNIVNNSGLGSANITYGQFHLTLYTVDLLMKARVHTRMKTRKYTYQELVWTKSKF